MYVFIYTLLHTFSDSMASTAVYTTIRPPSGFRTSEKFMSNVIKTLHTLMLLQHRLNYIMMLTVKKRQQLMLC